MLLVETNNVVLVSGVQQSDSVTHSFSYYFPLWFITGLKQFPVLHSRAMLFIHSVCNSLPLLIPTSQSNPSHCRPSWQPQSVSVSLFLSHG